jgi:hypothetical protein
MLLANEASNLQADLSLARNDRFLRNYRCEVNAPDVLSDCIRQLRNLKTASY